MFVSDYYLPRNILVRTKYSVYGIGEYIGRYTVLGSIAGSG